MAGEGDEGGLVDVSDVSAVVVVGRGAARAISLVPLLAGACRAAAAPVRRGRAQRVRMDAQVLVRILGLTRRERGRDREKERERAFD